MPYPRTLAPNRRAHSMGTTQTPQPNPPSRCSRSTAGTTTEIYDYLRLRYASVGQPHCPNCHRPISRQSADQIVERIVSLAPGERITVFAPIVRGRKGEFREELEA